MSLTKKAWKIFNESITHYHVADSVDALENNPYPMGSLEHLLYAKNWVDTVQWHLEDLIRDENIAPQEALSLKRRIDASNQTRTDMVEYIDSWFLQKYQEIKPKIDAKINTETPAWAIDRLSILALKVYHMALEARRDSATEEHKQKCEEKLKVLIEQQHDLCQAIDELLVGIENGDMKMKVYKQMKMYNDESLNPILYTKGLKS